MRKQNRTNNSFQASQKQTLSWIPMLEQCPVNPTKRQVTTSHSSPHREGRAGLHLRWFCLLLQQWFGFLWTLHRFQLCWKRGCYVYVAARVMDHAFLPRYLNGSCCAKVGKPGAWPKRCVNFLASRKFQKHLLGNNLCGDIGTANICTLIKLPPARPCVQPAWTVPVKRAES